MGTANISGIGSLFMQGQSKDAGIGIQEGTVKVSFGDVMNQMTAQSGNNMAADAGISQRTESISSDRDYSSYQYRETNVKKQETDRAYDNSQLTEKLEEYAEEVKSVLKEELGVSEEQIEEAMETLGLTYADFMNPNQLAALVAELTGAQEVSELLCNGEFLTVMQTIGELNEELLTELGVSAEEFTQMIQAVQNVGEAAVGAERVTTEQQNITEVPEELQEEVMTETPESSLQKQDEVQTGEEQVSETVVAEKETSEVISAESTKPQQDEETMPETDAAPEEGEAVSVSEPVSDKDGSLSKDSSFSGNRQSRTDTGDASVFQQNTNAAQTVYSQNGETVISYTQQVDVQNIIKQIVEFSKITVASTETTMEMQLNPAHLGKLYLELTAKDGSVSAHIMAQNEVVKEALEAQIADLKQNLNQAGIKVDAVEVTIGTHEFERNLEQNAKQEEEQAKEQEKLAKQTRRINLNDPEELAGIMTEEESLVAQMMADQGNSIDFTA